MMHKTDTWVYYINSNSLVKSIRSLPKTELFASHWLQLTATRGTLPVKSYSAPYVSVFQLFEYDSSNNVVTCITTDASTVNEYQSLEECHQDLRAFPVKMSS